LFFSFDLTARSIFWTSLRCPDLIGKESLRLALPDGERVIFMPEHEPAVHELTERTRRQNELICSLLSRNQELRQEIWRLERTLEEAQVEAD
jgi:hypothetical protein